MIPENRKPIPKNILIFGAANHIGRPMAEFLSKEAPQIQLRLVSSKEDTAEQLKKDFPNAEVVIADFLDLPSMEAAVDGMEGIYACTPMMLALQGSDITNNFISAVKKSDTAVHIVRQLGFQPEYNQSMLPDTLKTLMGGEYTDIPIKRELDKSGLPITYLNFGATFMDNIILQLGKGIREQRKMIWHHRKVPFIDPRDIGEVAARLLLSDNHRHIGVLHTLNNGNDCLRYSDVAEMMSEIYDEPIEFVCDKEAFMEEYLPIFGPGAQVLWHFFEFEGSIEVGWALNDFGERILGRKPTTVKEWLTEHRAEVLGE